MVSMPPAVIPPLVVMGVQGSGKTTVGRALAVRLGVAFIDGDELHSPESKTKMAAGYALSDADREPWLRAIGAVIGNAVVHGGSVVVACSALKRSYRALIRAAAPETRFVHLDGARGLIAERLSMRRHEYMPPTLLDSQFMTLEPLDADEPGVRIDLAKTPEEIVADVAALFGDTL
ncbi:gluconokinase [Luethyella okanaganae]|uniref:Gluconokinase n=1 Tax=Luethyella okanaganae TaxID=69372 RepID=A0ABW1VBN7_9MICO